MDNFHSDFSLLPNATFAGLVVLLGLPTVSSDHCLSWSCGVVRVPCMMVHIWGVSCRSGSDEDPCSYQPEDEDSSGDHKGEMHT